MTKLLKKVKVIHLLIEECPACGYQEFACGVENARNYSYWTDDVSCKKCKPSESHGAKHRKHKAKME
jgi:predicted nucleic-acid-binding Zn-ribbon protein